VLTTAVARAADVSGMSVDAVRRGASRWLANGRFGAVRSTPTRVACAAATALAAVGACSGGDEPGERITRIDGPAIVDEDRDGQTDE